MSKSFRSRIRSPMRGRFESVCPAGEMRRRVDVGPPRLDHRHPQGVVDAARAGIRRSGRSREKSAARRRRSTSSRRAGVCSFSDRKSTPGPPATLVGLLQLVELVDDAVDRIDDAGVAVAVGVELVALNVVERQGLEFFGSLEMGRPALDRDVVGDRKRPLIRLARDRRRS